MTKGKIMPILLRFTIPLMIGNMFQQLYNMVDSIVVGRQCRQWNPSVHHFFHFDDGILPGDHASTSGSDEYTFRHF